MTKSFFITASFLLLTYQVNAQTGTVIFQISDILAQKGGKVSAGIFLEDDFPKIGKALKSKDQKVNADYMEITLEEVPIGTYGAVAYQDIDLNNDLNTNFVGFPKEPIGFANGAKIRLGPPSFDAALIHVKGGEATKVSIKLQ